MRRYKSVLIAPGVTALLLLVIFALYQQYPFAGNTLSWCDMNQQVIPILLNFKDILAGEGDLFLNMSNAGGMNFWGVFLFFISSPFSLLTAFVSKQDMSLFMNILVLLKMAVCAGTAAYFFRSRFERLNTAAVTALSVMYAFCGYAMMYYQNVVWLDMMYLFPLLLIGADRLVRLKKPLMYILTLCGVLAVNFYLSYMVVLFLIFSMAVWLLCRCTREDRPRTAVLFLGSSAVSALLTAPVWLPALMQYLDSARGTNFLANLASGNFFTAVHTTLPIVLCTAVIAAALPFFARQKKERRAARPALLLFLFLLIPLFIDPINKMWHTGSYQAFPARYGYMTVFLGLILVAMVLNQSTEKELSETQRPMHFGLIGGILILFALAGWMISFHFEELSIYTRTLWGNSASTSYALLFFVGAFLCYFVFMYLYRFRRISKRAFSIAFCAVLVCECLFSASIYIGASSHSVTSYQALTKLADILPKEEGFYRVKNYKKRSDVNMTGALGYASLAHYTSLTKQEYLFGMKKLGYSGYWMEINSNGGTLLTDALLSNRYSIKYRGDLKQNEETYYSNSLFSLVENEFFLPLGLKISSDPTSIATLPDASRIDIQEYLYKTLLGGEGALFTRYLPTSSKSAGYAQGEKYALTKTATPATFRYEIPVSSKQTLYFDCFNSLSTRLKEPEYESFGIEVNGMSINDSYPDQKENGLLELGTFENETVIVDLTLKKNITVKSFGVYGLNHDLLQAGIEKAPSVDVAVQNNTLTASCEGKSGEYLYLSVPYDKGFAASVNGKSVELYCVNDTFMAVPLEDGQNQITLSFLPVGIKAGFVLLGLGLVALFFFLWWVKRGMRASAFLNRAVYVAFLGLAGVVFFAVYIFPVVVYIVL